MAGSLVILLCLITGAYLFNKEFDTANNTHIAYSANGAISLCAFGVIYQLLQLPFYEFICLTSYVTGFSALLVSLLMFVRNLKPKLFRYPYFVVFIPFILPLSFLLIYNVIMLREIMLVSLVVVILLVSSILINSYNENEKTGRLSYALMGIISLAILNRTLMVFPAQFPVIEQSLAALGSLALFYIFLKTFKNVNINHNSLL